MDVATPANGPQHEIVTRGEESATQLCKSCGICCRGLLHSHGVLNDDEFERLAALGLELVEGGQSAFVLPCSKFAGCCTIYDERPGACRGFRCALLRNLDNKQIGLPKALEIVREARRLESEAMPNASAAELAREFRAQRRFGQSDSASEKTKAERLKLIALGLYLDKYFVLPRDGNFYSAQPVAGSNS